MRSSIQVPITCSHGQRSASVSGIPARILATFAAGWNASASANCQPRRPASSAPTVVLPLPDTPATMRIMALRDLPADHDLAGVLPPDRDHPGLGRVGEQ